MEGELSSGLTIAVDLIIVGWVLILMVTMTAVGHQLTSLVLNQVTSIQKQAEDSKFEDLNMYDKPLPATTVYNIAIENEANIESISGSAYGIDIHSVADLKKLFAKKVRVNVTITHDKYTIVVGE